jgi:hypothetical protein
MFHADRHTDRRTYMTKPILVFFFGSFANMPENKLPFHRGTTINGQYHRSVYIMDVDRVCEKSTRDRVCIKCDYHTTLWLQNVQEGVGTTLLFLLLT